jgi:hypothetical protein
MPNMPGEMSKGDILQDLDALLSDPPRRDALLADMEARTPANQPQYSLASLAVKHGLVVAGSPAANHLANDWFGPNWWTHMTGQEKEDTVRAGLIVACREAKTRQIPIDCYWVCALHGMPPEKMQVTISWSDRQVTVILLTPKPPVMLHDAVGDPIKIIVWENGQLQVHDLITNTRERVQ